MFERRGLACALESRPSQWKECKGGTLPLKVRPKKEVSRICKAYEDKLKFSTINVVEKTRPKVAVIQEDPFIENLVEISDDDEQEEEVNINRIPIPILINY